MSVSLQKGQRVNLKKEDGSSLKRVMIGLGWDEAKKKGFGGLFSAKQDIDCDATAFVCTNGKLINSNDIVYYHQLRHHSGCIIHQGDNLTGAGDGDDEQIFVDLEKLPAQYDKVVFVVNIYQALQRKQHFGMVENAFIRICDNESGKELLKYNLSENYDNRTAMIFGEVYRNGDSWKFAAIGEPTNDNDIKSMAMRYQ